jgi:hypothetical protein
MRWNPYYPPWYHVPSYPLHIKKTNQQSKKRLSYPPNEKPDTYLDAHIKVFKCIITTNVKMDDYHIVNLFQITFKNIISKEV